MADEGDGGSGSPHAALAAEHARREQLADEGGGLARQRRQTRLGRLTARERVLALADEGTFVELARHVVHDFGARSDVLASNRHPGDGLVAGVAAVDGLEVAIYAHDPTVLRGALGWAASRKLCRLLDLAGERGLPVIGLADSDGVRVEEGTFAVEAYGEVMRRTIALRGRVPQITLVCGLCVGAAAYNAALTDIVGMVDGQSFMFITGSKVTEVVTGQRASIEELGGPAMHASVTGACHAVLPDERAGLAWVREVLAHLRPSSGEVDPPDRETPELERLVPVEPRRGYDVRKVVRAVVDHGQLTELSEAFARNLVTGLARLGGRTVGVVASNPVHRAGCLDIDASRKGAAFIDYVAARGYPLLTLVDVPGYWPGLDQERGGILPFGALLLRAYGDARVPKVCAVLRKSFGGANVLSFEADYRIALPLAQVAPMGVDAAEKVSFPPLSDAATPEEREAHEAGRRAFRERFEALHGGVWAAASEGYFDVVVAPAALRLALCAAMDRFARP